MVEVSQETSVATEEWWRETGIQYAFVSADVSSARGQPQRVNLSLTATSEPTCASGIRCPSKLESHWPAVCQEVPASSLMGSAVMSSINQAMWKRGEKMKTRTLRDFVPQVLHRIPDSLPVLCCPQLLPLLGRQLSVLLILMITPGLFRFFQDRMLELTRLSVNQMFLTGFPQVRTADRHPDASFQPS